MCHKHMGILQVWLCAGDQWNAFLSTSFTFFVSLEKREEEDKKLQEVAGRQHQGVE